MRTPSDVTLYFVVDSWQDPPLLRLVKRSMAEAVDLLTMPLPKELLPAHQAVHGSWRGIASPVPEIVAWLKKELEQD